MMIEKVQELFREIFENLCARSRSTLQQLIVDAYNIDELKQYMEERKIVRVNWCGDQSCAFNLKDQVAGEIRGTRWDVEEKPTGNCILCGDEGEYVAYVSRTY